MDYLYVLIIVANINWQENHIDYAPYAEVNSAFNNIRECDKKITEMHDYYLAKDIRRKNNKKRNPKFIRDVNNNKILKYRHNNVYFFASCKKILEN